MKKIITRAFLLFISFIFVSTAFAQTVVKKVSEDKADYKLLKSAQDYFEMADYGKAISTAEQAKESRIQQCKYEVFVLDNLQRLVYVRKAGDLLTDLQPVLKEHTQNEAYNLINSYIEKYGLETFSNSYSTLIKFIEDRKPYPEADFLIGKIYRLEGETSLAEHYYLEAYAHEDILNVPDVKYEILYELADLCSYANNKSEYEKYLLLILKDNKTYMNKSFMDSIVRVVKTDKIENVEKFFNMYRSENYASIKALNLLSKYYAETNDLDKAIACAALGSITVITRMEEIVRDRMTHYTYTTFKDLLTKSAKYSDIRRWGNSYGSWELLFNFADISSKIGCNNFAGEFFKILAEYPTDPYYEKKAALRISE